MPCVCAALGTLGLASLAETLTPSSPCCGLPSHGLCPRTLGTLGRGGCPSCSITNPLAGTWGSLPHLSYHLIQPLSLTIGARQPHLARGRSSARCAATYEARLGYVCRTFVEVFRNAFHRAESSRKTLPDNSLWVWNRKPLLPFTAESLRT